MPAQGTHERFDALGAQAVEIQVHAQLQQPVADLAVVLEEEAGLTGPVLGERRNQMLLLGVEVPQQRGLERQPLRRELLEVAVVCAGQDGLESAIEAVVVRRQHALQRRQPFGGDHDALASTGSSTSAARENEGKRSWMSNPYASTRRA